MRVTAGSTTTDLSGLIALQAVFIGESSIILILYPLTKVDIRSKVEDKSAPSKSIPIDRNAAISDIKQAAKQRRASFIGTSDTAGFSFNLASSDPQHPIVGLKVHLDSLFDYTLQ